MSCYPRLWTGDPQARPCQRSFANSSGKVYSPHPTKIASIFGHNFFVGLLLCMLSCDSIPKQKHKILNTYTKYKFLFLFLDICLIRASSDIVHPESHPENAASSNSKVGIAIRSLRDSLRNRFPGALAKTDPVSALGRIPHFPLSAVGLLPSMKRLVGRNRPFLFAVFFVRSHSSSNLN